MSSRLLAVGSGVFSLVASLVFMVAVTRRLPEGELALLARFNAAFAIASAALGYITTWYPRILARDRGALPDLLGLGLLFSMAAASAAALYLALSGVWDPALYLFLFVLTALAGLPTGAYLSVYRQTLLASLSYLSQAAKVVGAFVVRLFPTADTALAVNVFMSLPTAAASLRRPRLRRAAELLREAARGASYQTLALAAAYAGGLYVYVYGAVGGDKLLSYSYVLFQASKAVYPALAIVPLMYGSLLRAGDKTKRALLDGAAVLYFYLAVAAVMASAPDWLVAFLRPGELSGELVEAMRANAVALLLSGFYLHLSNFLLGVEEKAVFTARDKPGLALLGDLALTPAGLALAYYAASAFGAVGMVAASAATTAAAVAVRALLLGAAARPLVARLYLPALGALALFYLLPMPRWYKFGDVVTTLLSFIPNGLLIAALALAVFAALSPAVREALVLLYRRLR